jgi:prevent-host-death family protein
VTTQVNLYEAKTKLSDLVERAVNGEDIVIAKSGRPRVRLVPVVERSTPRAPGRWEGQAVFGEDWDADLTDQFEDL